MRSFEEWELISQSEKLLTKKVRNWRMYEMWFLEIIWRFSDFAIFGVKYFVQMASHSSDISVLNHSDILKHFNCNISLCILEYNILRKGMCWEHEQGTSNHCCFQAAHDYSLQPLNFKIIKHYQILKDFITKQRQIRCKGFEYIFLILMSATLNLDV